MGNSSFEFKKFIVYHDRCAMKVGTDGVLLGAWASLNRQACSASPEARRILDVGTGTGLIALQLAQRYESALVAAIEIDADAALQARENAARSPWAERITVSCCDFKTYSPDVKFDLIVSNPPYFVDALKCPDFRRNTARHTDSLNYDLLFRHSASLLWERGELALVIPTEAESIVMDAAWQHHFHPVRRCRVFTKPGKPCRRLLLGFRFEPAVSFLEEACVEEVLCIRSSADEYTPEYVALTKEFYLKM